MWNDIIEYMSEFEAAVLWLGVNEVGWGTEAQSLWVNKGSFFLDFNIGKGKLNAWENKGKYAEILWKYAVF